MISLLCIALGGNPYSIFIGPYIAFFFGLAVTELVFSILRIASNTILLCALEDLERNDGSTAKPYFMSENIKTLLLNQ